MLDDPAYYLTIEILKNQDVTDFELISSIYNT